MIAHYSTTIQYATRRYATLHITQQATHYTLDATWQHLTPQCKSYCTTPMLQHTHTVTTTNAQTHEPRLGFKQMACEKCMIVPVMLHTRPPKVPPPRSRPKHSLRNGWAEPGLLILPTPVP